MAENQMVPGFCGFTFALVAVVLQAAPSFAQQPEPEWLKNELRMQWDILAGQVANPDQINRFATTVYNPALLIDKNDKDPVDVVLRRTTALLDDLSRKLLNATSFEQELSVLQARNAQVNRGDGGARYNLYLDACRLRRKIAFANPLVNFNEILFAKHAKCGPDEGRGNHMCDQYFGFKATPGGGIFIVSDIAGPAPKLRNVLENSVVESGRLKGQKLTEKGSFISPSLSYDGKTVYFAYTELGDGAPWSPRKSYHIFKVNVDGSHLQQLTDGTWNEFDPCELPNGRVVFISERRGGYGRCHGREVPVFTLHSMNPNGSDIICLSYHESNEWHPSVNNDGMIVYTRWDYIDRGFGQAHHPWITTPDGRDPRAITGNYPPDNDASKRPFMEMHVRAIPDSHKYVATAAPHHGQAYGSLVVIDRRMEDDDQMGQVRRLTPEALFPEGEDNGGYPYHTAYESAQPMSENYFLVTWDPRDNDHGIYLFDAFGNRELIYRDHCLNPIPLRARTAPPILPHVSAMGKLRQQAATTAPADKPEETGTITLLNVYESLKPLPPNTKITALRIIQVLPKTTPYADNPQIGYGAQKNLRQVLGTVPAEADGSAYFVAPARKPMYFQALDERGLAVQSMRSDTYLQPGDQLACQGCHNRMHGAPRNPTRSAVLALGRSPSQITPEPSGSKPFNYPRLVQNVLDRNCVACHTKSRGEGKKSPDLSNAMASYGNLRNFAFFWDGAAITTSRTIPGQFGARASKLFQMLDKGHHNLKLSAEDLRRITLWLDSNSDFLGACENVDAQRKGELVYPSLE